MVIQVSGRRSSHAPLCSTAHTPALRSLETRFGLHCVGFGARGTHARTNETVQSKKASDDRTVPMDRCADLSMDGRGKPMEIGNDRATPGLNRSILYVPSAVPLWPYRPRVASARATGEGCHPQPEQKLLR
jgi:hypothetical protein